MAAKKVLDEHQYSINLIIFEVRRILKFNRILRTVNYAKAEGYPVTEIFAVMIMLPWMLHHSVNGYYPRQCQ